MAECQRFEARSDGFISGASRFGDSESDGIEEVLSKVFDQ